MSKIWVNGKEIELANLTPEEIYKLTHSENLDYIEPDGMYYSATISGDGSFDAPYGVAKMPNALEISVVDGNGSVSKQIYDGSCAVEVSIDDYRSVVDQNTLDGNGTEHSPFKVSDELLSSINSAYTLAIDTAYALDDMQLQIESAVSFQMEVSAKADTAIEIAESAMSFSLEALETASVAEILANQAIDIAESASTDVDKLYDFVSTLIYTIEYNNDTNQLEITYVDGTTSTVDINDITVLEEEYKELSSAVTSLNNRVDNVVISLESVVKDVEYNKDNSTINVTFVDQSEKQIILEDIISLKDDVADNIINTTTNTENIYNLQTIVENNTTEINNINIKVENIYDEITNINSALTQQSESINELTDVVADIAEELPNAVVSIAYEKDDNGHFISYTTVGGDVVNLPMSGVNELNEKLSGCIVDVTYNEPSNMLSFIYLNGDEKKIRIKTTEPVSAKTVTIYLDVMDGADFVANINGEDINVVDDGSGVFPLEVTGNSVNISLNADAKDGIEDINLNGQILNYSDLSNMPNLTSISNLTLPSNCSDMFADDINLTTVDVNADFLINGEKMFEDCWSLTDFNASLKTLIIANDMFKNCKVLTGFSTDMPMLREGNNMFKDCEQLENLTNMNLKRLEDGTGMFYDCDKLTDVSGIQLDKLTVGNSMFYSCDKLITNSIQCPNLVEGNKMFYETSISEYVGDLKMLEYADSMFANDTLLKKVVVKDLNNLKYANYMFANDAVLEECDIDNGFDDLIEADGMFSGCSKLNNISTKWNFQSLTKANCAFKGCSSLTSIDVDMDNLREAVSMFENCEELTGITASVKSLTNATDIFKNCPKLYSIVLTNLGCSIDISNTIATKSIVTKLVNNMQEMPDNSDCTLTVKRSQLVEGDSTDTKLLGKNWKRVWVD